VSQLLDCTHIACPQPCKRTKSEAGSLVRPGRVGASQTGAKPRSRSIRTSSIGHFGALHRTGGRSPDQKAIGLGRRMANGMWVRFGRKRPATRSAGANLRGTSKSAEPYERRRTPSTAANKCRSASGQAALPDVGADKSRTPRDERTADDRPIGQQTRDSGSVRHWLTRAPAATRIGDRSQD
jgi:hypothetical protein